jgi:hypothetical protein
MKTLKAIAISNYGPFLSPEEFWPKYDAGEFK